MVTLHVSSYKQQISTHAKSIACARIMISGPSATEMFPHGAGPHPSAVGDVCMF